MIQQKTEKHGEATYIKIKVGEKLKQIIGRCKDSILSPYIVHKLPERIVQSKNRSHHTQILPDYLTKAFGKTRDATVLFDDIPEKERPTFHEIRALGIVLYEKGGINPDNLAGHMTEEMRKLSWYSMDRSSLILSVVFPKYFQGQNLHMTRQT